MMRRVTMLVVVLLMAAFSTSPAIAKSADNPVPFKADAAGDQVFFGAPSLERCPEIGAAADFVTSYAGAGNATHLGRFTVEASHCTDFDTGMYGDGVMVLTAANGDQLMATYTNGITAPISLPDDLFGFVDEFTFVDGGTGRFTFASGGGVEAGIFDGAALEWSLTMIGEIFYSKR